MEVEFVPQENYYHQVELVCFHSQYRRQSRSRNRPNSDKPGLVRSPNVLSIDTLFGY